MAELRMSASSLPVRLMCLLRRSVVTSHTATEVPVEFSLRIKRAQQFFIVSGHFVERALALGF